MILLSLHSDSYMIMYWDSRVGPSEQESASIMVPTPQSPTCTAHQPIPMGEISPNEKEGCYYTGWVTSMVQLQSQLSSSLLFSVFLEICQLSAKYQGCWPSWGLVLFCSGSISQHSSLLNSDGLGWGLHCINRLHTWMERQRARISHPWLVCPKTLPK